jgi:hypothetical protein
MLITNLPGRNQTPRMRIWRALKSAGSELLRDGVYILPDSSAAQQVFEEQQLEISTAGGTAYVVSFEGNSPKQQAELLGLFDRSADYQAIIAQLNELKRGLADLQELDARRRFATIARDVAALQAVDFFAGNSFKQLQEQLNDTQNAVNATFSPNEPHPVHRKIARRLIKDFQGKTWATRERMWIDRVCSAWLIRRFIDRRAKFVWLKNIKNLPKRALGFDFDGAEFSHVDSKVTFEVLLTSFGLDSDIALARLGTLVHFLDVGGIPVAEAPGLAAMVSGMRTLQPDDAALLKTVTPLLDSLYQSYSTSAKLPSPQVSSTTGARGSKGARPNRQS